MFPALQNLNVLEILRVGLAGLCFLLALLAFWLIQREQQRIDEPRRGILHAIYTFMTLNLLSAALVATAGYLGPRQPSSVAGELGAKTYLIDSLQYQVDLTKWTEQEGGPVEVTRTDHIRKVSDTQENYVVPYFTTGTGIDVTFLTHSSDEPEFVPNQQPGFKGQHYVYKIPIGSQPAGHTEAVSTVFTFHGGFKGEDSKWWEASIPYPARSVSVVIRFPEGKPCKKIRVSKVPGIGEKQPMRDNEPALSNERIIAQWVGLNLEANIRIHFDWDW
jgi:hypothetical protein